MFAVIFIHVRRNFAKLLTFISGEKFLHKDVPLSRKGLKILTFLRQSESSVLVILIDFDLIDRSKVLLVS